MKQHVFMHAIVIASLTAGCRPAVELKAARGAVERPAAVDEPAPPETESACIGSERLGTSTDPAARGPWPVGVRTVKVGRLDVEVWYPASAAVDEEGARVTYDVRAYLPESERTKVGDDEAPIQTCDCVRDLPVDSIHGPYPVVVFVHGTAGFRTQSLSLMTHWASRGFIVLAADHPGLWLHDVLGTVCGGASSGSRDLMGDVDAILAEFDKSAGALEFLSGRIDATRIAVAGHSAGGSVVAQAVDRPGVRVLIPMAAATPIVGADVKQVLFLGGKADGVVPWAKTLDAYLASARPVRLVGIERSGHLAFADLCETLNPMGENLLQTAERTGVCGAAFAGFLFDCDPEHLRADVRQEIIRATTTLTLEETLQCRTDLPGFASLADRYHEDVAELQQQ